MRDALGQALVDLAPEIPELVVLDADVSASTKTAGFAKAYPDRFFNVGRGRGQHGGHRRGHGHLPVFARSSIPSRCSWR